MSEIFDQFQEAKERRSKLDKELGKAEGRLESAKERKKEVTDELKERGIASKKELKKQIEDSQERLDGDMGLFESLLDDAESLLQPDGEEDVD